jgi:Sortase domain
MSEKPPTRAKASKYAGWVPFLCVLAAIFALAGSALTWVISPNWGGGQHVTTAKARNIGRVPIAPGALVAFVSPNSIEIPKLGANAPIVTVSTLPDGALDVPLNPKVVGWWNGGAKPGAAKGTAILDGHINYNGVDGVLSRIGTLNPGDTVYINGMHNSKKTRVKFSITGVRTYQKTALPYKEIFDQKSIGRIAIVTCGGPFDAQTGNYLDNIVAFAVPA